MVCNTVQALSTCKGENVRKLTKPFKWHNCVGVEQIEGDKYEGEYKFGKFSGHGTYTWSNGSTYVGGWSSGRMHGYGIYRSADGKTSYEGEFNNGDRDGIGIKKSADGKISGVIYKNGRLVKQEFKIDMPDGEGTHIYPDGSKYVGNFQNGFKHGNGTLTWDGNNGKYVGDFKNGFKHGKGSYALYEEDNHVPYLYYDGEWKYEMRHGDGEEEYPDGSKYIGSYIDDKRNGKGVMIFSYNNKKYEGNWINNKLTLYESCQYTINDFKNLLSKGLISKEELRIMENSLKFGGEEKVELLYGSEYHGGIIFINNFCLNAEKINNVVDQRVEQKLKEKKEAEEQKLKEAEEQKLKEKKEAEEQKLKEAEEQKEKGEKLDKFILDNVITVDYDGKKQSYKFNKNNTYEVYENGKVAGEGKWTIKDLNKGSIELSGYQDIYFTIYKTKNDNNYTVESLPGKILSIVSLNDFEKQLAQIELEKQKALEQKEAEEQKLKELEEQKLKEAEEQKLKELEEQKKAEEQKLKEAEEQKIKELEEQKLKELEEQKKAEEQKLKEAEEQVCEKEITNEEGQKIVINECVNQ